MRDSQRLLKRTGSGLSCGCSPATSHVILSLATTIIMLTLPLPMTVAVAVAEPGPPFGWTQIDTDPENTPGRRVFHGSVYDSVRNVVLIHGGGGDGWLKNTWSWDGQSWSRLSQDGPQVIVLGNWAFDSDRGTAVLYGGLSPSVTAVGGTWQWDGQQWQQITNASQPGARAGSVMAYDPIRKRVVLHGGHTEKGTEDVRSDTWEWDGIIWREIPNAGGPVRAAHQMVYDAHRKVMVLFGGFDKHGSAPSDTWEYEGRQWNQVAADGPPGRVLLAMAYDQARGVTVITGGGGWPGFGFELSDGDDTWEWNGHTWSEVAGNGHKAPSRLAATGAYDANRELLVLFGGRTTESSNNGLAETWEYSGIPNRPHRPVPANKQADVFHGATLSWKASAEDRSFNVYIGTDEDTVKAAHASNPLDVMASQGQLGTTFDPGHLAFNQTYYWRIDEVMGSPNPAVIKGNVWRFTTEPYLYPNENVAATASGTFGPMTVPENTVNGSGLTNNLHGIELVDMWLSDTIPAWIHYEFDRSYKLHEMWIWNANQNIEPALGFGAKDIVIEYSINGVNWTTLESETQLAQAPGVAGYGPNNVIKFTGLMAKYVRIHINTVYGMASQTGISEVRFFHSPVFARNPDPSLGITEESLDVVLRWWPGREAALHQVVLSENQDAVIEDSAQVFTTTEPSFDLSGQELKFSTTYYWKVNEVNEVDSPRIHTGNLWHFNTPAFLSVDDMECYRDEEFLEIWAHWIDGVGDPQNGSIVGNETVFGTFVTEANQVHEGRQSLPMAYDNSTAPVSETTRTFDPTLNWDRGEPQVLSLFFLGEPQTHRGKPFNDPAPLYARINDSSGKGAQVIHPNPSATQISEWTEWQIPLNELNTLDLSNIHSMTIGIGGDGSTGKGKMYFDNIRVGTPGPVGGPI